MKSKLVFLLLLLSFSCYAQQDTTAYVVEQWQDINEDEEILVYIVCDIQTDEPVAVFYPEVGFEALTMEYAVEYAKNYEPVVIEVKPNYIKRFKKIIRT